MKTTKIIITHSPKTSGCTAISINMAILRQLISNQKTALLQLTPMPDLHLQIGYDAEYHIGDLVPFLKTDEWDVLLLDRIKRNNGCDFFFSPKDWSQISLKNFQAIFSLLEQRYEVIYLDLNADVPENIKNYVFQKCHEIELVASIDPLSLNAVANFWEKFSEFQPKMKLILNQCPSGKDREIRRRFLSVEIPFLGALSAEPNLMWHQIYEGIPVVVQKKSKLKKQILKIVELTS